MIDLRKKLKHQPFEENQNVPQTFFDWQIWLRNENKKAQHLSAGDYIKKPSNSLNPTPNLVCPF